MGALEAMLVVTVATIVALLGAALFERAYTVRTTIVVDS